jgi:hypothetical protein
MDLLKVKLFANPFFLGRPLVDLQKIFGSASTLSDLFCSAFSEITFFNLPKEL